MLDTKAVEVESDVTSVVLDTRAVAPEPEIDIEVDETKTLVDGGGPASQSSATSHRILLTFS